MHEQLTAPELATELKERPGLIPTAIDAARRQTIWLDLEGYHCYEGFFHHSLALYRQLRRTEPASFRSDLDSLLLPDIGSDCIQPAGFIFHAGRCGSTLLVKSLARSRRHVVFGEAAPHNQIWRVQTDRPDSGVELFRRLVLLMGRRRLPAYTAHIVKFTSFNIMRYQFIRNAFPAVPALFLFREPGSIMQSCLRQPPEWLGKNLGIGEIWDTVEAAIGDYFRTALSIRDTHFLCLDYAALSVRALPAILRFFRLEPTREDFRMMASEFSWDSKSGIIPRPFASGQHGLSTDSPGPLNELYERLRGHHTLEF